ncbi:MAG: hypothetical protein BJ554DRAFT_4311, partial [Olpidium bornovanus]
GEATAVEAGRKLRAASRKGVVVGRLARLVRPTEMAAPGPGVSSKKRKAPLDLSSVSVRSFCGASGDVLSVGARARARPLKLARIPPAGFFFRQVIDLKVELAKQQAAFNREKAAASFTSVAARKPVKKPSVWQKKNAGVEGRSRFDQSERKPPEALDWEAHRKILEEKAKLYERLKREGDGAYLSEAAFDCGEERRARKKTLIYEDPWVEYTDEFGRVRVARRSQVLKEEPPPTGPDGALLPEMMSEDMRREMERRRGEADAHAEIERGPLHYDASKEVRTKGVGFYKFSTAEEERAVQMEELNAIRQKTEMQRALHRSVKDRRREQADARLAAIRAKTAKAKGEAPTPAETKAAEGKLGVENGVEDKVKDALGTARITADRSVTASEEEVRRHQAIASFLSSF